jgi:uncharacterized protein with PQ loop repeat
MLTENQAYDVVGYTSSFFFLLTIYGIYDQIRKISLNVKLAAEKGQGTKTLSINQFLSHFLGVYAFFVYGFLIEDFNPYLVWPRLVASCFVLVVIYQIASDRRGLPAISVFWLCLFLLLAGIYKLLFDHERSGLAALSAKVIIVFVTIINIQGYVHQIYKITKAKSSGALSLKMNILVFLKDLSSFALGAMMGLSSGWPVMLQSFSNGFFRAYLSLLIINYSKRQIIPET